MTQKKKTILIADDDTDLLAIIQRHLQKAGFSVALSPNGYGITRMAHESRPDIILLDVSMDGISGEDICRKLKSDHETADIPIIMFSANEDIDKVYAACGANDYVRKPFDSRIMQATLRRYLH